MRTQATLFLSEPAHLEQLRRNLDPIFASRISLHATLIYDNEAPDVDLLIARLRAAGAHAPSITLYLGQMVRFDPPADGIYATATASAGFWWIRDQVLRPPFSSRGPSLQPHVTIVHPSRVSAIDATWQNYVGMIVDESVLIASISVIEFNGSVWRSREDISLGNHHLT
jgi:hypothetical protein